jgi:hypothetical protein
MSAQGNLFQEGNQEFAIDACAILDFWGSIPGYTRKYDIGVKQFRVLWEFIATKIDEGVILLPKVVYDEIIVSTNKEFTDWLKTRETLCVDFDDSKIELAEIVNKFEIYTTPKASLQDAQLVSIAKKRGVAVITSESKSDPISYSDPKIPNVCEEVNVNWFNLPDFFKHVGL